VKTFENKPMVYLYYTSDMSELSNNSVAFVCINIGDATNKSMGITLWPRIIHVYCRM